MKWEKEGVTGEVIKSLVTIFCALLIWLCINSFVYYYHSHIYNILIITNMHACIVNPILMISIRAEHVLQKWATHSY